MPEAKPPAQSSRPRRRKRWLIPFIVLAALIVLIGGWYAWISRPAGRAEALLEQLRQKASGNLSLYERTRRSLGLGIDAGRLPELQIPIALADIGPEAIPTLAEALKGPAPKVRACAATALGEMGEPAGTEPLVDVLAHEKDATVLKAAVEALGQIGDRRAVPGLAGFLASDKDPELRAGAARSLGWIGGPEARAALEVAVHDRREVVRFAATGALGPLGDAAAVPTLLGLLDDPDGAVRCAAWFALGDLGDRRAVPGLLAAAQKAESVAGIVQSLGQIGDPKGLDVVLAAAGSDKTDLRQTALMALGRIGGPRARARLESDTADPNVDVRSVAVTALGRLGGPEALPHLLQALKDPDEKVRAAAANALGYLGNPGAAEALAAAARDESFTRHLWVFPDLAIVSGPENDGTLLAMIRDSKGHLQSPAYFACGLRGRPEVVPYLVAELSRDDFHAAFFAAAGLARIGTTEARRALEKCAAGGAYFPARRLAAAILKDGLTAAMVDHLRNRPKSSLGWASVVLRCLADPASEPLLEKVRTSAPDAGVRDEAARIIEFLHRRMASTGRNS